ncbi:hypothetical protein MMG00_01985 [Ignatzschineria rhizosphaerae]|uniref:Uncharacterized protein n=1 Tax=Ignatzschineria rhizosphaerae TaxID=2923279 RepID=A0ABY3X1A1_9GAMM|nr:hypothetical protein [Ignatzschineria rhizosphaerae]UNM96657.1 hypothetical protein MMG00_01985 [Ignatzschineria rhizosphaerae]
MKRLILLPVLMFGLSFACDRPYEEVAGIKIGCSVSDVANLNEYTIPEEYQYSDFEENLIIYQKEVEGEIFQFIYIGTLNDVVHMVDLINYIDISEDQLNQVINGHIEEFGEPIDVQTIDEDVTNMTFKGRVPVAESLLSYRSPYRGPSSSVSDEKTFRFGISYRTKEMVEISKIVRERNSY